MKISKYASDETILRALGARLARLRLDRNLTQAELAVQVGVSKRTVERMEAGGATQLSSFIRLCRTLDLIDRFDALIPETIASPILQLRLRGKERRRASSAKSADSASSAWQWDDAEEQRRRGERT